MPLVPELEKQTHSDVCELQAMLIYVSNSRPARAVSQKYVKEKFFEKVDALEKWLRG